MPIHFIGSVAHGFKDVLQEMCNAYELQLGKVLKNPMDGLVKYHREQAAQKWPVKGAKSAVKKTKAPATKS